MSKYFFVIGYKNSIQIVYFRRLLKSNHSLSMLACNLDKWMLYVRTKWTGVLMVTVQTRLSPLLKYYLRHFPAMEYTRTLTSSDCKINFSSNVSEKYISSILHSIQASNYCDLLCCTGINQNIIRCFH